MLIDITSYKNMGGPGSFKEIDGTKSGNITLSAGQHLLLEMNHCNQGGPGYVQLAVQVPSASPKFFSLPEVQQLSLSNRETSHVQAIRIIYGDANITGFDVLVSAPSPANKAMLQVRPPTSSRPLGSPKSEGGSVCAPLTALWYRIGHRSAEA